MKRSAYDEDEWESADSTLVTDGSVTSDGRTNEKRQRSTDLPILIGPFTFAPDMSQLQQAVIALGQSNLPGVYRVQTHQGAPLRLWVPQRGLGAPLDTDSRSLLGAIQYQCIFLFDTRASGTSSPLAVELKLDWLLSSPAVQRYGAIVSKHPPDPTVPLLLPYVQDPTGVLMAESHVYDYLGPTAVCIRNGELLGTMMLQRAPEDVLQTLGLWGSG